METFISTSPAHTPAPWLADLVDLCVYTDAGVTIAVVHQQMEPDDDSDITSGNARLLAAAPDLLTALNGLVEELDYDAVKDHDAEDCPGCPYCDAVAAIAKAEGRG